MISTSNNSHQKFNLLLYYQSALAVAAVFTFFTQADIYFPLKGISPLSPVHIVIIFCLASIPLVFSISAKLNYFSLSLILWCIGYVLISIFSFVLFPVSEVQYRELRLRLLAVIFLLATTLIFSTPHKIVHVWARRAILVSVLIAIYTVVYNVFDPTAFRIEGITTSLRPAGLYVDPNKAGCALIIGMIFSVGLIKPAYRLYFIVIIGLVILLTFSRGAILGWLLIVIIMLKAHVVPSRHLLYLSIGLGIIAFFLSLAGTGLLSNLTQIPTNDPRYSMMFERLDWFQNPSSFADDDSSESRFQVAMMAWELFAEHPFWGNGIGSTSELNIGINTHNMYLLFMADHGIIGAFIMPLLAYIITRDACGESKYLGYCCATLLLLWSLFSHTVLEDRFIIMMVPLMAAIAKTNQLEHESQVKYKS